MTDLLASALSNEEILLENSLAIITERCVVIRASTGRSHSILSLSRIRSVNTERLSTPGLLVLAAGAFLISAAAHASRAGVPTEIGVALVGTMLVAGYLGSRRAAVRFNSVDGTLTTPYGSLSEAAAVKTAVQAALLRLNEDPSTESVAS
jgi:hypothetical protein